MICPGSVLFCAAGYLFLCIFNNNFLQPQPGRMEEIMPVKYVFVTGGVVSGLGKGITAASLGRLLKARGFSVTMQKFDPYINIDPGTMNPIQHGEVFVTDDGAETDLDLGHYERFIDESLNKNSNVTTGKVYWSVLQKERRGDFGGGTVQVIPHITNEIKSRFYRDYSDDKTKIAIIEVGGTVGAHSPCPDRAFAVGVILVFAIPVVDAVVVIQCAAVGLDAATVGVAPDFAGVDGIAGRFRHDLSPVGGQRRVGHFRLGTVQFERTQGCVQRVGSFVGDSSARKL